MLTGGHDKWHPQFIEKLLPLFKDKDNGLVLAYPQSREIKIDETFGDIYLHDYTTMHINHPVQRYKYILKNLEICNIIYGIWKTEILKKCFSEKPIIRGDIFILLQAVIYGKFKHYKEVLFWARNKESYQPDLVSRHFRMVSGISSGKIPSNFLLMNEYLIENLKMIYKKDFQLSFLDRLNLSIHTIYDLITRLYIRRFLIRLLKKVCPDKFFFFIKNIIKQKDKNIIKS